jgi:pectate lyase
MTQVFQTLYLCRVVGWIVCFAGLGAVWMVSASACAAPLTFTSVTLAPGVIVLSGVGGPSNEEFFVLAATNLSLGVTNWPVVATNTFDASGQFIVTNPVAPGAGAQFFRLQALNPPIAPDPALVGFATLNGGTTGGTGGDTIMVTNRADFRAALNLASPTIVQVAGAIDIGNTIIRGQSNKTVLGLGTNATLLGNLQFQNGTNIIVRNLHITNPSGDGITLQDFSERVWVDHCTFGDCGDGQLDITHGSDIITVSWCKFAYTTNQTSHRFCSLVGHADDNAAEDQGRLSITYHHNWWSTLCHERMPRVRFGHVHVFNNYYFAPGNNYCATATISSELLLENNSYRSVDEPWRKETGGKVRALGNVFVSVTGNNVPATDTVFTPPYTYALQLAADVPMTVTNLAGAGRGPFAQ